MGKIKPARTTPAQKRNSVVRWIFYFVVIVCSAQRFKTLATM